MECARVLASLFGEWHLLKSDTATHRTPKALRAKCGFEARTRCPKARKLASCLASSRLLLNLLTYYPYGLGRGCGVGRDLDVGVGLGVGVGGGGVGVPNGGVGVGVAVAVGVTLGVVVAVGVAVAVAVGVGDGPPPTAAKISTRPQP